VRGEPPSLDWIAARFSPLLLAQASHRLRGPLRQVIEPEDLVQDVWVRALPNLAGLQPRDGRLTPVVVKFLGTALLNRLNSLLQKRLESGRGGDSAGDEPGAALDDDATRALTRIVRAERASAVRAAIEELAEEDRAVVVLRGIEQNPVQEVAVLLGMLPNTVTVQYRRALEKLRAKLPGSVFDEFPEAEA
jgi:RNA polymerase sigma-70 factor (ECF subfamily)